MKNPKAATAYKLCDLARTLLENNQYDKAESALEEVLEQDMENAVALSLLGDVALARGERMQACGLAMLALNADPSDLTYKEKFVALTPDIIFNAHSPQMKDALLECLKTPGLDLAPAQRCWHSLFALDPVLGPIYGAGKLHNLTPLHDPFFLLGISRMVVCDTGFENFLTLLRRTLLDSATPSVTIAAALSQYCYATEYIFNIEEAEREKVAQLKQALETAQDLPALAPQVAIYACYAPLSSLKNAGEIEAAFRASPPLADVVATQVTDHNALMRMRESIKSLTPVTDSGSLKVREMYEEFPYPRWGSFPKSGGASFGALKNKGAKILVAGCGTGNETMQLATAFSGADILAVDLSLTSLAYASTKAKEFGVKNVKFMQADILRLGETGLSFDFIVCGGVLHHMEDPMKGWKTLCGLLKPDGLMVIALYSRTAHEPIVAAKKVIDKNGYPSTPDGMRAFRRDAARVLDKDTLASLTRLRDYYQMSMFRDMLFHVQDRRYDLDEIAAALRELQLSFINFIVPETLMQKYRQAYPRDPEGSNLENWRSFEEKNPRAFAGMYQFWCRKTA
jgi:2-polyprenyl-3-methyl-5-hydroxy-6-metoxy-1,4-benzoquinol methylase